MNPDKKKVSAYDFLYPVILLTAICLVAAALLALTNSATQPIIEAAEAEAAERTRMAMLPDATTFTELECETANVVSVFKDDGGSGYVITVKGKGYGGDLPVTVGLTADGEIIAVSANAVGETAGVGSKTGTPQFTDRFKSLRDSASGVDVLTGASVSSRAVIAAVNQAFAAYQEVKEG